MCDYRNTHPHDWDDKAIEDYYDDHWEVTVESLARLTGKDKDYILSVLLRMPKQHVE